MQADAAPKVKASVAARRRGHRSARKGRAPQEPKTPCGALVPEPAFPCSAMRSAGVPPLRPDPALVLVAVESLYREELKPFGRILRKRVAELAGLDGRPSTLDVGVDAGHLRDICEMSSKFCVQEEEGGDWSAILAGVEGTFVDVYSPVDFYSCKLWSQLASYFDNLDGDEMLLPGGRYACAQALVCRGLPFFADCSIGQVCHIVQLAISQKKILGYLNGSVVPYKRSQSIVKEQCAACQQASSQSLTAMPFASWECARSGLRLLLQPVTAGIHSAVPLSNVKRLFRSQLHMELSETMLGHSKLSDLLQDERFADICSVHLERNGYTVMPQGFRETSATVGCGSCNDSSAVERAGRQGSAEPKHVSVGNCAPPASVRSDVLAEVDGVPLTMSPFSSHVASSRSPAMLSFSSSPLVLGFHIDDCTQNHMLDELTLRGGVAVAAAKTKQSVWDEELSVALLYSAASRRSESGGVGSDATAETAEGSSDDDSTAGSAGSTASVEAHMQWWGHQFPLASGRLACTGPPPGLLKPVPPSGLRSTGHTLRLAGLL